MSVFPSLFLCHDFLPLVQFDVLGTCLSLSLQLAVLWVNNIPLSFKIQFRSYIAKGLYWFLTVKYVKSKK